ncbi:LysR family transcriptional regulator [uncultured Azohydromonas sp.]|jgi:Transcriptional regulator|uniref:LysR family transcriptional regulator n=1 Tax=uncultured Azohydromonas sp. TaxID=487342 RepID=UPI00260E1F44|nr:LysR family transcriptional regulator [uncultured Azohydromonas sp.]
MDHQFAMRCFSRVVATGSFAAAARDLNCSPPVITKQVQQLEAWTGSRLIARTTRSLHLTEAGERFLAYCTRVLSDTDAMLEALRASAQQPVGRLVVSAPVSLTLSLLSPYLHAFQDLHPKVELEVRLNDRVSDLIKERVDVALRGRAELEDSTLVAVPLMTVERVLCASPDYWRRRGLPEHPADLAGHNCLAYVLGSDAMQWRFELDAQTHQVEVQGDFRTDNSLLLADALRAGRGVGVVPRVIVERDLREGRLEPALLHWRIEPRQLFAVYPSREHLPGRLRAFVDFLRSRLADAESV